MEERKIQIRRFGRLGSAITIDPVEEAEKIVQEALDRGAMVIDENTHQPIKGITPDTERILIVNPMRGG